MPHIKRNLLFTSVFNVYLKFEICVFCLVYSRCAYTVGINFIQIYITKQETKLINYLRVRV